MLKKQSICLSAWIWITKLFFLGTSVSHILPNLKCHKAKDIKDLFCTEIFCTCSFKNRVTRIGNIKCLATQIRDWSYYSPCVLSDRWTCKLLSCADPVFFKNAPLKENNWFFSVGQHSECSNMSIIHNVFIFLPSVLQVAFHKAWIWKFSGKTGKIFIYILLMPTNLCYSKTHSFIAN